ncbi:MAG: ParB/RepB/Spo0J family partition protein [Sphingomonadales bacterium]|nr:ParB/RepB/Spo0J family partition protein [Sphingomonadales bacterium]
MEAKESRGKTRPVGLGRGLSALLGSDAADYATLDKVRTAKEVPIELLRANRYQPRHVFNAEALDELVDSIREKGILQPILVRRVADSADQYEIIAGERRWRAAQKAKLHKVPVVIKDLTDGEMLEVALIENIQRSDLTPIEEARGYERLMNEFSHTQEQLSQLVGKSRSHVANLLRLLTLPKELQDMLADGRLTMGHARALINADDPVALAKRIVQDNLNVRATEDLARAAKPKGAPRGGGPRGRERDPDTAALELDLSQTVGLKVTIMQRSNEAGELRIAYSTLEQLDDLCQRLCRR